MKDWTYCSSLAKAKKNNILLSSELEKYSTINSKETLLKVLKDTSFASYFNIDNMENYDTVFETYYNDLLKEFKEISPDDTVIRYERSIYDLNNIKYTIKSKLLNSKFEWVHLSEYGNFNSEDTYIYLEKKLYYKFHPTVANGLYSAEQIYGSTENRQLIDFIIDKSFYLLKYEMLNYPIYDRIRSIYKNIIDLENIKNIMRAKKRCFNEDIIDKLIIPNGFISPENYYKIYNENIDSIKDYINQTEYAKYLYLEEKDINFILFEKSIDEFILTRLRSLSDVAIGIEVLFDFLTIKKMEIKNLKIFIIGILNNIESSKIRERLRRVI